MVIPTQQEAPRRSGFPPDFINFITLLFRPMAAMAIMMKNLDSSFSGANTSALIPILIHAVVIIAAMMKYKNKHRKCSLYAKNFPAFFTIYRCGFCVDQRQYKCNWNDCKCTSQLNGNSIIQCFISKIPHAVPGGCSCGYRRSVVNCCSGEQSEGRTARCVKAEDMPKYRE